jgi:hypothetical protein
LRIGLVLPDVLGTYGDNGNALVLRRRLEWRGIRATVVPVAVDAVVPDSLDLYLLGGGEDDAQLTAAAYLLRQRGLRRACARGAPTLAVCAGLQLFGRRFTTHDGTTRAGLDLLDLVTIPAPRRAVGEVVAQPAAGLLGEALTGFENHLGTTALGPSSRPLANLERGTGNDGRTEGAIAGHVIATYLHGPVLARNPELADLLLSWAVGGPLSPLDLPAVQLLRRDRLGSNGPGGVRKGGTSGSAASPGGRRRR